MTNLKVIKKDERGYILENGVIIEDTFAEMSSPMGYHILEF